MENQWKYLANSLDGFNGNLKKNTTAFANNNVLSNKDHTKVNKDYDFLPHPTYFLILASRNYLLYPELVEMARPKEIWLQ